MRLFAVTTVWSGIARSSSRRKVNETLVPKLNKLPGVRGLLPDRGRPRRVQLAQSLRDASSRPWSRRSSSPPGSARRSSTRCSRTSPRSRAARSSLAATRFWSPRSPTRTRSTRARLAGPSFIGCGVRPPNLWVDRVGRLPYSRGCTEYGASEVDGSPSGTRFGEGQSGCRTRAPPLGATFCSGACGVPAPFPCGDAIWVVGSVSYRTQ